MIEIILYLIVGFVSSMMMWSFTWFFGNGDNDGIHIGIIIWTVIFALIAWVIHMALIGMGVIG